MLNSSGGTGDNNSLDNLSNNNNNKSPLIQDYNSSGLLQIGSPSPMLHHTHASASASATSSSSQSMLMGHHQPHPLIYHPPNPNDWYHTGTTGSTADTMNPLNHFGHHHHHHLVHHGPTTAYWEQVKLDEFYF